jgi:hypothetical protein
VQCNLNAEDKCKKFGNLKKIRKRRYRVKYNIRVDTTGEGYAVLG